MCGVFSLKVSRTSEPACTREMGWGRGGARQGRGPKGPLTLDLVIHSLTHLFLHSVIPSMLFKQAPSTPKHSSRRCQLNGEQSEAPRMCARVFTCICVGARVWVHVCACVCP